jgi:ethanolamine ammonia-lyase large subunit
MSYRATVGHQVFGFADLRELMGKASPARSGDALAGVAAGTAQERVAAQAALADVPRRRSCPRPWCPTSATRSRA